MDMLQIVINLNKMYNNKSTLNLLPMIKLKKNLVMLFLVNFLEEKKIRSRFIKNF